VRVKRAWAGVGAFVVLTVGCALGYDFSGYELAQDAGSDAPTDGAVPVDAPGVVDGSDAPAPALDAACDAGLDDPSNCGYCGHDCLGGQCIAGQCTPVVVASNQNTAAGLAVSDAGIFWTVQTSPGAVEEGSLVGSGQGVPFAANEIYPDQLALSATYAYWTTGTDVRRCSLAGCAGGASSIASALSKPVSVAAPDYVYWTVLGTLDDAGNGTGLVMRVDPQDLDASVLASAQLRPDGLAVDVTNGKIYWIDKGTGFTDGTLNQANVDGTDPVVLAAGLYFPHRIAFDDTNVYWTNFGTVDGGVPSQNGSVMSCPRNASACPSPVTVASGLSGPVGIAVDATYVYWVDVGPGGATGDLSMCPKPGCGAATPTVLVNQLTQPQALVEDALSLYWTERTSAGYVKRLAKP
jgi:hypothetical protein